MTSAIGLADQKTSSDFSDVKEHWANNSINKWADEGLVSGYPDGSFKPNKSVTRAEFIAMVNRVFNYSKQAELSASDVSSSDWFYGEIAKAKYMEYITGYEDGKMKPNNTISRQEVAVIIARIMMLSKNPEALTEFVDADSIPEWSKGMVGAVVGEGYMIGYPNGEFMHAKAITRAEAVIVLDRVVGELYNLAGTYGPEDGMKTVNGNVTINTTGVTLKNMTINGDLHLTAGIGDGDVLLQNVDVTGTTLICGGGEISVAGDKGTTLNNVIVEKKDGKVRVKLIGDSKARKVIVKSSANLTQTTKETNCFGDIIITIPQGGEVELQGGADTVIVESQGITMDVADGSTFRVFDVKGNDNTINFGEGAKVTDGVKNDGENNKITWQKSSGGGGGGGGSSSSKPPGDNKAPEVISASVTIDGESQRIPVILEDEEVQLGETVKVMVVEQGEEIEKEIEIKGKKKGFLDLSDLESLTWIIDGMIEVSEDCKLTVTVPENVLFDKYGLVYRRELMLGENTLDVHLYLGDNDNAEEGEEEEGVSLSYLLNELLEQNNNGESTCEGTLTDAAGNTSIIKMTVKLPQ